MDPVHLKFGLILYLMLLASLSVHEWAHAITADLLGDHTPRSQGRVTLNPMPHIDLLGTVIFPLFMLLGSPGFFILGWAKPVEINIRNFKNSKWGHIWVTLAGPASNIILALLGSLLASLLVQFDLNLGQLMGMFIRINVILAVFNLLPIPPLDGSHIFRYVVGMKEETFFKLSQWGFLILIILINIKPFQWALSTAIMYGTLPFVWLSSTLSGVPPGYFF